VRVALARGSIADWLVSAPAIVAAGDSESAPDAVLKRGRVWRADRRGGAGVGDRTANAGVDVGEVRMVQDVKNIRPNCILSLSVMGKFFIPDIPLKNAGPRSVYARCCKRR